MVNSPNPDQNGTRGFGFPSTPPVHSCHPSEVQRHGAVLPRALFGSSAGGGRSARLRLPSLWHKWRGGAEGDGGGVRGSERG